jgi:hypothetical protein
MTGQALARCAWQRPALANDDMLARSRRWLSGV